MNRIGWMNERRNCIEILHKQKYRSIFSSAKQKNNHKQSQIKSKIKDRDKDMLTHELFWYVQVKLIRFFPGRIDFIALL